MRAHLCGIGVCLDVLEMGVFELSGIFEAETKEAIKANVGRPDQNQRKEVVVCR